MKKASTTALSNGQPLAEKDCTTFNSSRSLRKAKEVYWTNPTSIGLPESVDNEFGIRIVGKKPRDNLSGKKVDNDAKIVPFRADFEISDVASPNSVRFVRIEFALEEILEIAGGSFSRLSRNFAGRNFGQVHRFNEATNSGLSDFKAIFTLQ